MDAGVFFQILFGFCGFICIRYCLVPLDSLGLPITMGMSTCTPSDGGPRMDMVSKSSKHKTGFKMSKLSISAAILSKVPEDTDWEINGGFTELKWWRRLALCFGAAETIIENVVDDLFIKFKQSFNLESDSHDYM